MRLQFDVMKNFPILNYINSYRKGEGALHCTLIKMPCPLEQCNMYALHYTGTYVHIIYLWRTNVFGCRMKNQENRKSRDEFQSSIEI